MSAFITAMRTRNPLKAQLVQELLSHEGIPSFIVDDGLNSLYGAEHYTPEYGLAPDPHELQIDATFSDRAMRLVTALELEEVIHIPQPPLDIRKTVRFLILFISFIFLLHSPAIRQFYLPGAIVLICAAIYWPWTPALILAYTLRNRGYDWVGVRIAKRVFMASRYSAFKLPPASHIGVLPGYRPNPLCLAIIAKQLAAHKKTLRMAGKGQVP